MTHILLILLLWIFNIGWRLSMAAHDANNVRRTQCCGVSEGGGLLQGTDSHRQIFIITIKRLIILQIYI